MPDKPHYTDHRQRLRERFQKAGSDGLQYYELLELLLTYAISRKDVKPLAKDLIRRFGGLSGVLDADPGELKEVFGMGPASATLIGLTKELLGVYLGEKMAHRDLLASPRAAADFARVKLAGLPHEAFMVLYLNVKNEIIEHEIVHEGTVDRAVIYPRRIIESALAHHAAGLILVHNHPSGHPEPSDEDRRLTHRVAEAAHTMDIRVLDHVVVGREGYVSFAEDGLLGGAKR
jgi:DNA repair protein RadC